MAAIAPRVPLGLITEERPSLPGVSHLRESYVPMIRLGDSAYPKGFEDHFPVTKDLQVFEVAVALTKYLVNRNSCHLINAIDFVCARYDIQKNQIVQWMSDRCSVNLAAVPQLINDRGGFGGEYLAHTMDNCDVMAVAWMQIFTELLVATMSSCGGNNKATAKLTFSSLEVQLFCS